MLTARRADYIEDLFTGLVAAVYNYASSVGWLLVRPIRGIARLTVRRRNPAVAQLAPQTLIVVTVALSPFVTLSLGGIVPQVEAFVLGQPPSNGVIQAIVVGIATAGALDMAARILAKLLQWNSRRRRKAVAMRLMYGFACWVVYCQVVAVALSQLALHDVPVSPTAIEPFALIGASVPAIYVASKSALRQPHGRRALARLRCVAVAVVVMLTVELADYVSFKVSMRMLDVAGLSVPSVSCQLGPDGRVSAVFVLRNSGRDVVVIQPEAFTVSLVAVADFRGASTKTRVVDGSAGAAAPIYILDPGQTIWLKIQNSPQEPLAHAFHALARHDRWLTCRVQSFGDPPLHAEGRLRLVAPPHAR